MTETLVGESDPKKKAKLEIYKPETRLWANIVEQLKTKLKITEDQLKIDKVFLKTAEHEFKRMRRANL